MQQFQSHPTRAILRNERLRAYLTRPHSDDELDLDVTARINAVVESMFSEVDTSVVHPLDALDLKSIADNQPARDGVAEWILSRIEHYTSQSEAREFIPLSWVDDQKAEAFRVRKRLSSEVSLRAVIKGVLYDEPWARYERKTQNPMWTLWALYKRRGEKLLSEAHGGNCHDLVPDAVWPHRDDRRDLPKAEAALQDGFVECYLYGGRESVREWFDRLDEHEDLIADWTGNSPLFLSHIQRERRRVSEVLDA